MSESRRAKSVAMVVVGEALARLLSPDVEAVDEEPFLPGRVEERLEARRSK